MIQRMGGMIVWAMTCTVGCAARAPAARVPPPVFVRATPIIEQPPAQLVRSQSGAPEDDQAPLDPGPLPQAAGFEEDRTGYRARRPAVQQTPPLATPPAVIAEANAMASQAPEAEGFVNAVMTYTFVPGGIYQVYTAPENVTDLVLEPGEQITGEPAAGDTLRWRLGIGTSAAGDVSQTHVFIKPTRAGLKTNLTLNTNRRTYFIRLESLENTFMVAVQWTYPVSDGPEPGDARARALKAPGPSRDVSALFFDYVIEVTHGRPRWVPQAVFDDGTKTYVRFDRSLLHSESPALFVMQRGEMQLVNYRVKENLYVVDRLFDEAELRLGQGDQDVVRIRRKGRHP